METLPRDAGAPLDPAPGAAGEGTGRAPAPGKGHAPPAGLADLLREGYRYDFFQAVALLERALPDAPEPAATHAYGRERIRFRADPSDVFPATDLKAVEWADGRARVTARFMGLYGADSPLPYYFFEGITREHAASAATQGFLDLFDHRLYGFLYRAWKKYRPGLARVGRPDPHRKRFLALAGLATPGAAEAAPVDPLALAAFAGHLSGRGRTAEGLRCILADALGLPVEVAENVPRRVVLPERPRLGRARLGESAVVGERVHDATGKFRIRLGPMPLDEFRDYLPGGEGARRLDGLVRLSLTDWLAYDVELLLDAAEVPLARLNTTRLGALAVLGRRRHGTHAQVVAYA